MKSMFMMEDLPADDKPRERLKNCGEAALQDAELVAIILGTGAMGISTVDLARSLLLHFEDDLSQLAQASIEELTAVHGIGLAKASSIRASFALAQRLNSLPPKESYQVTNPHSLALYLQSYFRGKTQEEFRVVQLDIKNQIQKHTLVSRGLINRTLVDCREVFRQAIRDGAAKLILVHNHPSGDPTPSKEDLVSTAALCEAGQILGIEVLDHLIIGEKNGGRYSSGFCSLKKELNLECFVKK